MVEEGETAHDTLPETVMPKESPTEIKPEAPIPSITVDKAEEKAAETAPQETPIRKSAYPGGIDPYREPIE
jgi:hypothetical protein